MSFNGPAAHFGHRIRFRKYSIGALNEFSDFKLTMSKPFLASARLMEVSE
jgi:hypothetical protein